jgi:hypothetical protein
MTFKSHRSYVGLLLAVSLWAMFSCDDPFEHAKCRWRETFSEQTSPDKLFVAKVLGWACKAGAENVTMMRVQVAPTNDLGSSETVFQTEGKYSIKTSWLDSRHLLIECEGIPAGAQTTRKDGWGQVKISFKCQQ